MESQALATPDAVAWCSGDGRTVASLHISDAHTAQRLLQWVRVWIMRFGERLLRLHPVALRSLSALTCSTLPCAPLPCACLALCTARMPLKLMPATGAAKSVRPAATAASTCCSSRPQFDRACAKLNTSKRYSLLQGNVHVWTSDWRREHSSHGHMCTHMAPAVTAVTSTCWLAVLEWLQHNASLFQYTNQCSAHSSTTAHQGTPVCCHSPVTGAPCLLDDV